MLNLSIFVVALSPVGCQRGVGHCAMYNSAWNDFVLELNNDEERNFYRNAIGLFKCEDISSVDMVFPNQVVKNGFYGVLIRSKKVEFSLDDLSVPSDDLLLQISQINIQFGKERIREDALEACKIKSISSANLIQGVVSADSNRFLLVMTMPN